MAKIHVEILSRLSSKELPKIEKAVATVLPKIASYIIDRMSQVADQRLRTAAHNYKIGLQQEDTISITGERVNVRLSTPLAQKLEEGYDAFDIKAAMLRSKGVKYDKKGEPYVDVAFRHGLEATSTRLRGMPADIKQKVQAAVRREQRSAKRKGRDPMGALRVTGAMAGGERTQALRFGAITQTVHTKTKTSIYSDMIRTAMQVGARRMGTYKTIRRISSKSAATSWWHSGFEGVRAIPQVRRNIKTVAKRMLLDELNAQGVTAK